MNIDDNVYFMKDNKIQEAKIEEIRAVTYKNPETNKVASKVLFLVDYWNGTKHEVDATECFVDLEDILEYLKKTYNSHLPF